MNYYIDKILKEKKITTFLEERGIFPVRKSADKLFYLCPIHSGDTSPSFVIYPVGYKGKSYQTYHCFGCHSGISLINLKSDLDGVSVREVVSHFLKNVEINDKEVLDSELEKIINEEDFITENINVENILLTINNICKHHLMTHDDEEERGFFDNFFKLLDKTARARDVETMEEILDILVTKGLAKRVDKFNQRKEEENLSETSWRL